MTQHTPMPDERAAILAALDRWIRQRPGLEYGNYGDPVIYRSECRAIARDKRDAQTLLAAVERSLIDAGTLKAAFRAFSGRLTWDGSRLSYVTGQYWPTEYRKAAAAVLAAALWDNARLNLPPVSGYQIVPWGRWTDDGRPIDQPAIGPYPTEYVANAALTILDTLAGSSVGHVVALYNGATAGDYLRRRFRREFGPGLAKRWLQ